MTMRSAMLPIATEPRAVTAVDVPTFAGRAGAEHTSTSARAGVVVTARAGVVVTARRHPA